MTGFDLTPLYRSTVGFDRLANIFDALGAAPEKPLLTRPIMSNARASAITASPWRLPVFPKMSLILRNVAVC